MIHLDYEEGSDNVFSDLGLANAKELKARTLLIIEIKRIVKKRKLKQVKIAEILGIPQSKVSILLTGNSSGFSTDRLLRFLNALDQDVRINIKPKPKSRSARISIFSHHSSNPTPLAAKNK